MVRGGQVQSWFNFCEEEQTLGRNHDSSRGQQQNCRGDAHSQDKVSQGTAAITLTETFFSRNALSEQKPESVLVTVADFDGVLYRFAK